MARRTRVPKDAPVKLVAVTKNHDVEAMREAIDAGATDIGENRIQEAKSKFDILDRDVTCISSATCRPTRRSRPSSTSA